MAEGSVDNGFGELARPTRIGVEKPGFGPDGSVPFREVLARGICVCGHRMKAHRGWAEKWPRAWEPPWDACLGVAPGRRLTAAQMDVDCQCREPRPVLLVSDGRSFRGTWKTARPDHPFTYAYNRAVDAGIEMRWLIDFPLVCQGCGVRGGSTRVAYAGTRAVSGFACEDCAPEANPHQLL